MVKDILKSNKKKSNKGITLISLVITIIILLILAGVTINLTIEENGIFELASKAGEKYQNEAEKEKNEIAKVEDYIENTREEASSVKKVVLFDGKADTVGMEYDLKGSIKDYSILLIYACLTDINLPINISSYVLDTDLIDIEENSNKYLINNAINNTGMYGIRFRFTANNKLRIEDKSVASGWSPYPYYIFRIVGIK